MTLEEFGALLQTSGLPVAYEAFPAEGIDENGEAYHCPDMPFITYQMTRTNNVAADSKVWKKVKEIQVDLFTIAKDETSEETLEAVFDAADIFWESVQSYDDNERCHIQTYTIQIL